MQLNTQDALPLGNLNVEMLCLGLLKKADFLGDTLANQMLVTDSVVRLFRTTATASTTYDTKSHETAL